MTPHGHVFLGLSLFVGFGSRRHSPTLQASREVSAVSEDVPLSVDPEADLVDGHIAEADPFLRHLLGRTRSNKEATVGGHPLASTCRGRLTNRGACGFCQSWRRGSCRRLTFLQPRSLSVLTGCTPFLEPGRSRRLWTRLRAWRQTSGIGGSYLLAANGQERYGCLRRIRQAGLRPGRHFLGEKCLGKDRNARWRRKGSVDRRLADPRLGHRWTLKSVVLGRRARTRRGDEEAVIARASRRRRTTKDWALMRRSRRLARRTRKQVERDKVWVLTELDRTTRHRIENQLPAVA